MFSPRRAKKVRLPIFAGMNDLIRALHDYATRLSSPPPPYLHQLERETHLTTLAPQMLSGSLQGRFLALLSKLMRPRRILEIGTFTGYGALCLAEGLAPDDQLHTIEANPEREALIRKYLAEAGMTDRIHLHMGDALDLIPTLDEAFDLVFVDAGKQDYGRYFDLLIGRLPVGALLIADNVLWSGKILDPTSDADAQALHTFNERVRDDARLESLILPLRDGLLLARKR